MTMRQGNFTAFFVGMAELCSIFVGLSPVGSVVDLRTGQWFDPRLGQYSFQGLMIVIMTGFISLSLLSVVSIMVMLESSQWLG